MGQMLKNLPKNKGGEWTHDEHQLQPATSGSPTLADLGIEKTAAHRYQAMAALSETELDAACDGDKKITSSASRVAG